MSSIHKAQLEKVTRKQKHEDMQKDRQVDGYLGHAEMRGMSAREGGTTCEAGVGAEMTAEVWDGRHWLR